MQRRTVRCCFCLTRNYSSNHLRYPTFLATGVYLLTKNNQIPCKPLLAESKHFACYLIFGNFIYFGISI
jgi:hypothetical protein